MMIRGRRKFCDANEAILFIHNGNGLREDEFVRCQEENDGTIV